MRICVLASGSKGNSTYIETENSKILIDAGLSKKEIERRLSLINISPNEINAILVTHEHSDHIKGIGQFARQYNTRIYAHSKNWDILEQKIGDISPNQQIEFNGNDFFIKDAVIQSFDVDHDSQHCVGFSIIENKKQFSIATDLGHVTPEITQRLANSDFIVLESNHDIQTLKTNPNYPYKLKTRILSQYGHISNKEASETIMRLLGQQTRGILLGHLSEQNNTPELAINTLKNMLLQNQVSPQDKMYVNVAQQDQISNIYKLKN